MNKVQSIIERFPPWILSIATLLAILWLTLAPRPLGDIEPPLFPGADKLAHAIMFGGLELMLITDYSRRRDWRKPGAVYLLLTAAGVILLGGAIEIMQTNMRLGRSADELDFIADASGAAAVALIIYLYTRFHHGPE